MKKGFLIGGGLLGLGLLLQLLIGPLEWSLLSAPLNLLLLALLLSLIGAMYLLRRKVPVFEWMMHLEAAVPCLVYAVGLTIVMGLTVQTREGGIPWLSQMLSFWPFVLIWTWMTLIAGLAALSHLLRWQWREIPFILNHLGLFLAIVCAALGSADKQELFLPLVEEHPKSQAMDEAGRVRELDFTVVLHNFAVERYESGSPRRFASDITVFTRDGKEVSGTLEVNAPMEVNGWRIYLYDPYVLQLVRDPWLPGVYAGIFLLLAGALCLLLFRKGSWQKWVLPAALLLTIFFTYLTVTRMGPMAKQQPPALQSPWFIPHLIVYMAGYAILSASTLLAIYQLITKRNSQMGLADNLVSVGVAFLGFGMLFGALWAKEAWGDYWTWDPKETWAAITWLCYLVYLHFRKVRPQRWRGACVILLVAFLCLQMCWWGINYLPSARDNSVHTYSTK